MELCKPLETSVTNFRGVQCVDGTDKETAYAVLKDALLRDVTSAYTDHATKVGGNVYTEMLAACPLKALEGLVVSLRGAEGKMYQPWARERGIEQRRWEQLLRQEKAGDVKMSLLEDMFGERAARTFAKAPSPLVHGTSRSILRRLHAAAREWARLFSKHVPGIKEDLPVFYYKPGALPETPDWTQHAITLDGQPPGMMRTPSSLTLLTASAIAALDDEADAGRAADRSLAAFARAREARERLKRKLKRLKLKRMRQLRSL